MDVLAERMVAEMGVTSGSEEGGRELFGKCQTGGCAHILLRLASDSFK